MQFGCVAILSVFLYTYGCETWLLTLREEHKLMVFENRMLRRIFGPKRDEETGEWRKLQNDELNYLYCPQNIVRLIKFVRIRLSGLGGLVVSMLASGTQVRRFKPGRSCRIFRAKKSSACLPSEGK
jgi:hypothetical protein